jgi:exoribonuclease-2
VVLDRQRRFARSRSAVGGRALPGGDVKLLVAIADVDAAVPKGSPSIGTRARTRRRSTRRRDLSDAARAALDRSHVAQRAQDRLAVVIEFVVSATATRASDVYGALVRNQAKLAYNASARG